MEEKGKAAYFPLIPLAAQGKEGKVYVDKSENNVLEEQSQTELYLPDTVGFQKQGWETGFQAADTRPHLNTPTHPESIKHRPHY